MRKIIVKKTCLPTVLFQTKIFNIGKKGKNLRKKATETTNKHNILYGTYTKLEHYDTCGNANECFIS